MEGDQIGQRYNVWMLWRQKKTQAQIVQELQAIYGGDAFTKSTVNKWVHRFEDGWLSVEDATRCGRPKDVSTKSTISLVRRTIETDRRMTVAEVADKCGISTGTAFSILTKELSLSRLVSRWVPRLLTEEMKQNRVAICRALLVKYHADPHNFLTQLVTGDETWVHHYEPEAKRQSSQWLARGSAPPVKAKAVPSAGKRMASVFWDYKGVVHIDWLPEKATINSDYYIQVLTNLKENINQDRRGKWSRGVLLQHDNARPHTSVKTMAAIQQLGFILLPHPAYSPDLAPSDYWLFPELKKSLRGQRYSTFQHLATVVGKWISVKDGEWFAEGLRRLVDRWEKCVQLRGDYVEKVDCA
jgi:[histone H3]-lysine36 N-dimethyltransferase SETMAR